MERNKKHLLNEGNTSSSAASFPVGQFGIPRTAIQTYLSLYPQCTVDAKKKKCPLKFMICSTSGAMVDLMDMINSEDPVTGHKWILK
jgi:hypothetical protein